MPESVKNKIIKILSEQTLLDPSEINENLSLEDLGVDSLALVEIVFSIEETFNINIPFNANDPTNSTFDIVAVVALISEISGPVILLIFADALNDELILSSKTTR